VNVVTELNVQEAESFYTAYPLKKRLLYVLVMIVIAVLIAGFWHRGLVGAFGTNIVAGGTIGDTGELAGQYDERGGGFGLIFAAIAGLAATFTACNCVIFAMMPGLACSTDKGAGGASAWTALGMFTLPVLIITAVYGLYVGFLGPVGIEYINKIEVRHAQSFAVFTALGFVMLAWGCLELGFLDSIKNRTSQTTREFFAQLSTKAVLLGAMVGMFTVGRPYPLFRDFLVYAASTKNPAYGALAMMIQGLGQIAFMVLLFLLLVKLGGRKLGEIATLRPHKFRLISGMALTAGGIYFLYYWGLGRLFDFGRWGYKLGWY
jgi:sulfite exporter TauE/SafE